MPNQFYQLAKTLCPKPVRSLVSRLKEGRRRSLGPPPFLALALAKVLPPNERVSLLDCGAAGGSLPDWNVLGPRLAVYGFEANAAECARLNAELKQTGPANRYFPLCIAGKDEKNRPFRLSRRPDASSSLYELDEEVAKRWTYRSSKQAPPEANLEAMRTEKVVNLDTVCLESWARQNGIQEVDFIKLDIHGAELEVLQGAGKVLDHTLGVQAEVWFVPAYKGGPLFADIDRFLRAQGFSFFSIILDDNGLYVGRQASPVSYVDHATAEGQRYSGQLAVADVLYLRDPLVPGAAPPLPLAKFMKLICVADLAGQFEFAFELLGCLEETLKQTRQDELLNKVIRPLCEQAASRYREAFKGM